MFPVAITEENTIHSETFLHKVVIGEGSLCKDLKAL